MCVGEGEIEDLGRALGSTFLKFSNSGRGMSEAEVKRQNGPLEMSLQTLCVHAGGGRGGSMYALMCVCVPIQRKPCLLPEAVCMDGLGPPGVSVFHHSLSLGLCFSGLEETLKEKEWTGSEEK